MSQYSLLFISDISAPHSFDIHSWNKQRCLIPPVSLRVTAPSPSGPPQAPSPPLKLWALSEVSEDSEQSVSESLSQSPLCCCTDMFSIWQLHPHRSSSSLLSFSRTFIGTSFRTFSGHFQDSDSVWEVWWHSGWSVCLLYLEFCLDKVRKYTSGVFFNMHF